MAATTFLGSTSQLAAASQLTASLKPLSSTKTSTPARTFVCHASAEGNATTSRREALQLAAAAIAAGVFSFSGKATATLADDLLAKTAANKALNDKKRLATSYANTARAYTVSNGTCAFPENFTGCEDLAKKKDVPFLSADLALECEGKEKGKCASNNFH